MPLDYDRTKGRSGDNAVQCSTQAPQANRPDASQDQEAKA